MAFVFGWFRSKPPSDVAQAVIALMNDPARWTVEEDSLRHKDMDLVVRLNWDLAIAEEWPLRAEFGDDVLPFKEADFGPVWKAYGKLRPRAVKHAEALAAQRLREKLSLPSNPAALPPPAAEPLEVVEARVRQLREAVLASHPPSR